MATIDAQDPRNQTPRARIAHVIQMNLDSPNKLCANFKHAFGALLAIDTKEFLDVSCSCCQIQGAGEVTVVMHLSLHSKHACLRSNVHLLTHSVKLYSARCYASAEEHLVEGYAIVFGKQTIVWDFSHLTCCLLGSCACTQPTA